MWKTRIIRFATCTLLSSTYLLAQRQSETLLEPKVALAASGDSAAELLLSSTPVSLRALRHLVAATCAYPCEQSQYTIVHLARWGEKGIEAQKWLLLARDTGSLSIREWSPRNAAAARIFGSRDVALLSVQKNSIPGIEYRIDIARKEAAPITSLKALLELAPILKGLDGQPAGGSGVWKFSSTRINVEHVPSDIEVRLMSPIVNQSGVATELAKQTFDNESKYHWDVSVGVPVTRVSQLEYVAADGVVRTREIDKQSLTAFLNLHLIPVDTKAMRWRLFPSLLLGTALSSRPLDRLVTALAIGTSAAQLYAGVAFERVDQPQTLATGAPATEAVLQSDLRSRYKRNFIVGLNVPVRQIVDRLAAQK